MHKVRIIGRKKYGDVVQALTEVGGMFHRVPSTSAKERILVVSNQQFEELTRRNLVEGNGYNSKQCTNKPSQQ